MEKDFVILLRKHNSPTMAKCAECQIKFFTLVEFIGHPQMAEDALREKFAVHECKLLRKFQPRAEKIDWETFRLT